MVNYWEFDGVTFSRRVAGCWMTNAVATNEVCHSISMVSNPQSAILFVCGVWQPKARFRRGKLGCCFRLINQNPAAKTTKCTSRRPPRSSLRSRTRSATRRGSPRGRKRRWQLRGSTSFRRSIRAPTNNRTNPLVVCLQVMLIDGCS